MPWTNGLALWLALLSTEDRLADLSRFPPVEISRRNFLLGEASVRRQERELCVVFATFPVCQSEPHPPLMLHSPERAHRIETLHMTRHCRDCWRALTRARDARKELELRRVAIEELRRFLGEDDWAAGQMPPAVPYWRFSSVR